VCTTHLETSLCWGTEARREAFGAGSCYSPSQGRSKPIHTFVSYCILSSNGIGLASRHAHNSSMPDFTDHTVGPYVYSLYKDQFGLKETIVAGLFTTGFFSGAISGYFVGQFADRYGRKTACLVFCVTYSIACLSTLIPNLPILFFGRVFGGLSTSLMYSAFESWMVTEYHKRQVEKAGTSLSSMFGVMTTLNSIVAILAGVFSEWLVQVTNTKRAPFMASAGLLMIAFWVILGCWVRISSNTARVNNSTLKVCTDRELWRQPRTVGSQPFLSLHVHSC
jgi:MFS family permease